jgi:hypothetical protein
MIIKKLEDGFYLTSHGSKVPPKELYEDEIRRANEMVEPSDKDLIIFAKEYHPYYKKELIIENATNNINEIDSFDKSIQEIIKK